ncbi:MAG: TIGR03118 family protein [Syntrophales bacterium]
MKRFNRLLILLAVGLASIIFMATGLYAASKLYQVTNLVSDNNAIPAAHNDPNLINSWGIAFHPNGFVCVADNGSGLATFYDGAGVLQNPVIVGLGAPTGVIFNDTADFVVTGNLDSAPATFLFATENGTILGWSAGVSSTNTAIVAVTTPGAVYKGLSQTFDGSNHFLLAADFNGDKIDVFNATFGPAALTGSFVDPKIPAGYAPFGIQNINGDIYVTYALQDAAKHDDVKGRGHGFVSVFDANGNFVKRLITHGQLNSPWGVALSPASFGRFGSHLLVGNFGDGKINAYDPETGNFRGSLSESNGHPIVIEGLWGIRFGNGLENQPTNALFFASGPGGEAHGLYGKIEAQP